MKRENDFNFAPLILTAEWRLFMITLIEILGTIAFAISGSLVGIRKRLDLFGVLIISIITSGGGGLLRDLFLNRRVPVFFTDYQYIVTIILTTIVVCIIGMKVEIWRKYIYVFYWFDAIGLGVFSVLSAYSAMEAGFPKVGVIFLGCLSGIGGSMTRDIIVREIPVVLRREIYAVASIIGILALIFLDKYIEHNLLIYICVSLVVAIRMISLKLGLHVPIVKR